MQANGDRSAKKPPLWTFIFIRVGIITAVTGICTQMFMSAFPQYLQQRGFSPSQMGFIASGYTICAMVMRIFAGNLIDTKGRRLICMIGLAFFGMPIVGFYLSSTVALIVLFRLIQGFGSSMATIAQGTMVPAVLHKERMVEGLGYYGMFSNVATAIGPAVGLSFLLKGNTDGFFLFGIALMVVAMAVCVTINYEKKQGFQRGGSNPQSVELTPEEQAFEEQAEAEAAEDIRRSPIWRFFDKRAIPAAILSLMVTLSTTSITNYISPYGIGIGLTAIGRFFTVQAAFMIVIRIFSGRLANRFGMFPVIVGGMLADVVALFLISTMTNNFMMYAAAAIRGMGGGLYFPMLNVLAVSNAARSRRGKATSTYYAAYDLGAGVGAAIWGLVADYLGGYRTVYFGAALLYVVTIPVTFLLIGRKKKKV